MALSRARILVVEDEHDVRDFIQLHLKREGYELVSVDNGEDADRLLATESFDLAVLDWMLPGVSGLELCRHIKGKIPVLMVTARAEVADIVAGLSAGADDYVTKPFEIPVLLARVSALLRRAVQAKETSPSAQLSVGELKVDLEAHEVHCSTEPVALTPSEFKVLASLLKHRGKVMTREHLIQLVQGEGIAVSDRTIDTHVFGLRKKLGNCSSVVETIRGVGYRISGK